MSAPQRIGVFLPNWIGDVVMATPALQALREQFADAEITHVGRTIALQTLDGVGLSDATMVDLSRERRGVRGLVVTARRLRRRRLDLAVLLPNSFRVALLARVGRARRRVGYRREGRGWLLTDAIKPDRAADGSFRPVPTLDYYCRLVADLGAECRSRTMRLATTPDGERVAGKLFAEVDIDASRPVVMLNPGASYGTSKLWPADRYAAVADALIDRLGAQIVINAAPGERDLAARVASAMRRCPAVNFAHHDNSIALLKSVMKRCSLLITNDTGARHIAAAMGIGVVTLFGSTDPVWARIDYLRERIVRVDVPCSPCQEKFCPLPAGPSHHQCMTSITPEMVLDAAGELLAEPAAEGGASS